MPKELARILVVGIEAKGVAQVDTGGIQIAEFVKGDSKVELRDLVSSVEFERAPERYDGRSGASLHDSCSSEIDERGGVLRVQAKGGRNMNDRLVDLSGDEMPYEKEECVDKPLCSC